ncbi:MAG TPA: hypothetical protein VF245_11930 [Solirubrobacterales bacterium]
MAAFLAVTAAAARAAPANDAFANAKPLAGPPLSVEFDGNEGASKELGEPSHAGDAGGHSVWYSWTPTYDVYVVLSTCTLGGSLNSLLAVYTGSAVNALTPVASNDDRVEERCHSTDSEVAFDAEAGVAYRIAVDGKKGSQGEFELVLRGTAPNDDFDGAQAIEPGESIPGTTNLATKQAGEPDHAGNAGGHSVWFSWTPSSSGQAAVSTCTLGGSLDPLLAVYTGSALDDLTPVASDDDGAEICSANDSRVVFTASAGTTYMIAVDGKNGSEGGFELWLKAQSENDEFASAKALDAGLPGLVAGSTALATKQSGEPDHAGNAGGHSVWFSWTPSKSGPVEISAACVATGGFVFNPLLAVYTGSAVDDLTPVASDDGPGCYSGDSEVAFAASAGTAYMIAVDGRDGGEGNFKLQLRSGSVGPVEETSETPETRPVTQALVPPSSPPVMRKPKPRRCKTGFKKVKAHGKTRCVKKRSKKRGR